MLQAGTDTRRRRRIFRCPPGAAPSPAFSIGYPEGRGRVLRPFRRAARRAVRSGVCGYAPHVRDRHPEAEADVPMPSRRRTIARLQHRTPPKEEAAHSARSAVRHEGQSAATMRAPARTLRLGIRPPPTGILQKTKSPENGTGRPTKRTPHIVFRTASNQYPRMRSIER